MIKRLFISTVCAITATLLLWGVVLAAWEYLFPINVIDISNATRTYHPVVLHFGGQSLIDGGKISDNGTDTNMQIGSSNISYMMCSSNVTAVIPTLPAGGMSGISLYTGYTPVQSGFPIITGDSGNVTVIDNAAMELGSDGQIDVSAYINTDAGSDKDIVHKEGAFVLGVDDTTSGTVNASVLDKHVVVEAVGADNNTANATTHTVTHIAGIASGELLIYAFVADGNPTITFPAGWTQLSQDQTGGGLAKYGIWYRVADGTEGASMNVTTSAAEMTAWAMYRLSDYAGTPEVGTSANGVDANPNPPSLTSSWGVDNTMWIAVTGYDDGTTTVTGYPAGYGGGTSDRVNNAGGVGVGVANLEVTAASEDPGTFTLSGVEGWGANTVAIEPAETVEVTSSVAGITSGEYDTTVLIDSNTLNWATGDVLHFAPGDATSQINCGAIYNASAKLWISMWYKSDDAPTGTEFLFSKLVGGDIIQFHAANDGNLYFKKWVGGVPAFSMSTSYGTVASWNHVLISMSSVNGARMRVNGGAAVTDPDVSAVPNGGNFYIGSYNNVEGFDGMIANVIVGTDDLTPAEELALYAGTAPGDETDYWYIDEGTGNTVYSYGSSSNNGTRGAGTSWDTSTYTSGQTGRPCDFYVEVGSDRGTAGQLYQNGTSVPDNGFNWMIGLNNVTPYIDSYEHYVSSTLIAHYEPTVMIRGTNYSSGNVTVTNGDATVSGNGTSWVSAMAGGLFLSTDGTYYVIDSITSATELELATVYGGATLAGQSYNMYVRLPDREGATQDGLIAFGLNDNIVITYGEMTSYESYLASTGVAGGYEMPEAEIPDTWFAAGDNSTSLPFYDSFSAVSAQTGVPVQMYYFWAITGVAFGAFLFLVIYAKSALLGYIAMVSVFGIGATMTIVPAWIIFTLIIVGVAVLYLYRQVSY